MSLSSIMLKILLCQVEFSVPILIEIRHCLADQDVAHVLGVLGVDEGSELLLVEVQVLVPVRHRPSPPVPKLKLLVDRQSLLVHIVLPLPPGDRFFGR